MTILAALSARRRTSIEAVDIPTPIATWLFAESAAPYLTTAGDLPLAVGGGSPVTSSSPYGGGSALTLDGSSYLKLAAGSEGRLNLGAAAKTQVTVAAWVRRTVNGIGFVGGIWQEDNLDPRRQYGLFLDLPYYGGDNMTCMHISKLGGATPGYPYSRDYSANPSPLVTTNGAWQLHVGTYDGEYIRSYTNAILTAYVDYTDNMGQTYDKNPYYYPDGLNNTPGDFTVGAVKLTAGMNNYLTGQIAHLRVWDVALTPAQIAAVYAADSQSTTTTTTTGEPTTTTTTTKTPGAFDPADLSGLALWLDAQTLTLLDGDPVTAWDDSSATTTLTPSSTRPIYRTTGVAGGPGVEFGSGAFFQVSDTGIARNVAGFTVIAAVQANATAIANGAFFRAATPTSSSSRVQAYRNGSELKIGGRRLDSNSFQLAAASGVVSTSAPQILSWIFDFTNTYIFAYADGTLAASNTTFQTAGNTSDTASQSVLVGSTLAGAGYQCDAIIGELVVYKRALTETERAQVETYLSDKWGIA